MQNQHGKHRAGEEPIDQQAAEVIARVEQHDKLNETADKEPEHGLPHHRNFAEQGKQSTQRPPAEREHTPQDRVSEQPAGLDAGGDAHGVEQAQQEDQHAARGGKCQPEDLRRRYRIQALHHQIAERDDRAADQHGKEVKGNAVKEVFPRLVFAAPMPGAAIQKDQQGKEEQDADCRQRDCAVAETVDKIKQAVQQREAVGRLFGKRLFCIQRHRVGEVLRFGFVHGGRRFKCQDSRVDGRIRLHIDGYGRFQRHGSRDAGRVRLRIDGYDRFKRRVRPGGVRSGCPPERFVGVGARHTHREFNIIGDR